MHVGIVKVLSGISQLFLKEKYSLGVVPYARTMTDVVSVSKVVTGEK